MAQRSARRLADRASQVRNADLSDFLNSNTKGAIRERASIAASVIRVVRREIRSVRDGKKTQGKYKHRFPVWYKENPKGAISAIRCQTKQLRLHGDPTRVQWVQTQFPVHWEHEIRQRSHQRRQKAEETATLYRRLNFIMQSSIKIGGRRLTKVSRTKTKLGNREVPVQYVHADQVLVSRWVLCDLQRAEIMFGIFEGSFGREIAGLAINFVIIVRGQFY